MRLLRRLAASTLARAAFTLLLLGLVALQIDWAAAADRLAAGRWEWFAAAVALLLVALVVGAVRWQILLRGVDVRIDWRQTLRAYAIGTFSNNFLPSSFGGDAARTWMVGRSHAAMARVATSVVVDRATGLGCLFLAAWICLAFSPGAVPSSLVTLLGVASAVGLAAVALGALALRSGGRLSHRVPERALGALRSVRRAVGGYARDGRLLRQTLLLGLVFQGLSILAIWSIARSIDLDLAVALVAVVLPLVLVLTIIPVSIAGFGLREGAFVVLLGKAGVPATDAALVSLLGVAALALSSLPGALALATVRAARPATPAPVAPGLAGSAD